MMSEEEEEAYEDDFEETTTMRDEGYTMLFDNDDDDDGGGDAVVVETESKMKRKIKSELDRSEDVKFAFGSVGFQHIRDLNDDSSTRETNVFKDPKKEFSRFEHISSPYDLKLKRKQEERIESKSKREIISKYDFVPCSSLHSLQGNERYEESPYDAFRKARGKER